MMMPSFRALAFGASIVASLAAPAGAQSAGGAGAPQAPPPAPAWEIGVHGGVSLRRIASGDVTLPDPGPAITTSGPTVPSRQTSSWFFGDGAAMFNDAGADFGLTGRITPLDDALASMGFGSSGGPNIGFRVARTLTSRVSAEFDFDLMPGSLRLTDAFVDAIESSRGSFQSAFTALLASGPFTGVLVETASDTDDGASREMAATGAATYRFAPRGSFVPYATLGGGVITRIGDLPSVDIEGRYRFAISVAGVPPVPIAEIDRVTIRYTARQALVAVLGGGLRRDVSDRWGFRIDGRVFLGQPTLRLVLDANPSTVSGVPAGFIETFTYPNLQFSSNPASGRRSTLGGEPLDGFVAVKGTGIETRVLVTVQLFFRLRP
jgi:hypothetical protein